MRFSWDPDKERKNRIKYGSTSPWRGGSGTTPCVILSDRVEDGEQRWHAVGQVGPVVLLVVVHAYPDSEDEENIRIIGARKATRQERKRYEEEGV